METLQPKASTGRVESMLTELVCILDRESSEVLPRFSSCKLSFQSPSLPLI